MITERDIKINKIKAKLLELRFLKDNYIEDNSSIVIEELDKGLCFALETLDEIMDNPPKSNEILEKPITINESPIFP